MIKIDLKTSIFMSYLIACQCLIRLGHCNWFSAFIIVYICWVNRHKTYFDVAMKIEHVVKSIHSFSTLFTLLSIVIYRSGWLSVVFDSLLRNNNKKRCSVNAFIRKVLCDILKVHQRASTCCNMHGALHV